MSAPVLVALTVSYAAPISPGLDRYAASVVRRHGGEAKLASVDRKRRWLQFHIKRQRADAAVSHLASAGFSTRVEEIADA